MFHTADSLDDESSVVQSFDSLPHSCESLCLADVHLHHEVRPISLEQGVGFLVQHYYNVSRLQSRLLIPLSTKCDLLTILHTFVHGHLQDLPLSVHLPSITFLTA